MIRTRWIRFYSLSVVSDETWRRAIAPLNDKSRSSQEVALRLFDAFLRILGIKFKDGFSYDVLELYLGFLLTDVDASLDGAYRYIRALCNLMPAMNMERSEIFENKKEEFRSECIKKYKSAQKDQGLLRFYTGWMVKARDGEECFANLIDVYETYGADEVEKYHRALRKYIRKYPLSTALGKLGSLKQVMMHICGDLPTHSDYSLLQRPVEVSSYCYYLLELLRLKDLAERGTEEYILGRWKKMAGVIEEFLVGFEIIAPPLFKLFKTTFKKTLDHRGGQKQKDRTYIETLTNIPIEVSDDETADRIFKSIVDDLATVVDICEEARRVVLDQHYTRIGYSYLGKVSDSSTPQVEKLLLVNQCATWEHFHYTACDEKSRPDIYGEARNLASKLGLVTSSSLLPFLYLLVKEHPAITASWLLGFELYDELDHSYGFRPDGQFAVSEKPRKGTDKAKQRIHLSQKAIALFREIDLLTKQQREYLKARGDDSWRYLLLSPGKGHSEPRRIKVINGIWNTFYNTSLLQKMFKQRIGGDACKDPVGLYRRISLGNVRRSSALVTYFNTGSTQAMADALGHDALVDDLLGRYLPPQLEAYFKNRWVRIFLNALTFEIMKDSPYLIESLDLNTMQELDGFLKHHRLEPLPAHLRLGKYGAPDSISDDTYDLAIIPISPTLSTVLVTLKHVIDTGGGLAHSAIAETWYQTARFMDYTVALHNDGTVICPSDEAVEIYAAAKYSAELGNKLRKLVYAV
jgi:hypothetical protein